jgi:hypothetical protein
MVMLVPLSPISRGCELGYLVHLQATVKHSGQNRTTPKVAARFFTIVK